MSLARRLVELGRAARADAKVRTRQPLRRALVASVGVVDRLTEELRREVADELNVGALEPLSVGRRRPGRPHREGQLPGARQAVRQADPAWSPRRSPPPTRPRSPPRWRPTAAPWCGRRRGRRGAARRGDRLRAPARGLVGGQRAGRDRRPRPRADPGAASAPASPARWCGWCRRPARTAASRSATGSRCAGRPTARPPRRCASTRGLVADEVLATAMRRGRLAPTGPRVRDDELGLAFSVDRV